MTSERDGISRRTMLRALGLLPLAAAVPAISQGLSEASANAATYSLVTGQFLATATGQVHNWTLTYPAGHSTDERLPVAIVLHGSGGDATSMLGLGYPEHLDAQIAAGRTAAFALASIDGYNGFYQQMGGRDYGKLVASEFVAVLASRGLDTSRLALTGWSMGGWGALRLAGSELRGRVSVIAAVSTPCYPSWKTWPSYERSDMTKAQFNANNFYGHPKRLAKPYIALFCGTSDGFYKGNRSFAKVLDAAKGVRRPTTHFHQGGHSPSYWVSVLDTQLRYLGRHL